LLELRGLEVVEEQFLDAADRAVTEVDDRGVAEELNGVRAARAGVVDGLAADEVAAVELVDIAAPAAVESVGVRAPDQGVIGSPAWTTSAPAWQSKMSSRRSVRSPGVPVVNPLTDGLLASAVSTPLVP
jgi:hypothetical protein